MPAQLMERLEVSLDRNWLVAQIETIESLSFREKISAGKCLGRFDRMAWSTEEVAFLGGGSLDRVREIATTALDHCVHHAPDKSVRTELNRIGNWLFPAVEVENDDLFDRAMREYTHHGPKARQF